MITQCTYDRLDERFRAWAWRNCGRLTPDDFRQEMWAALIAFCNGNPAQAEWLLLQKPSYIAMWATGRARRAARLEQRRTVAIDGSPLVLSLDDAMSAELMAGACPSRWGVDGLVDLIADRLDIETTRVIETLSGMPFARRVFTLALAAGMTQTDFLEYGFSKHAVEAIVSGEEPETTNKIKGISWNKAKGKWQVRATLKGKRTVIGLFAEYEEAVEAHRLYVGEPEQSTVSANRKRWDTYAQAVLADLTLLVA